MNFLFMRGSDTEMLQTCYNFPVLFPRGQYYSYLSHFYILI